MLSDATGSGGGGGGGGGGGDKMVSSAVVHKSAKTSDEDDDTRHVVLVGDSTLDNLIWVNNTVKDCVVGALRTVPLLNVTNYACDGFTSTDVLRGNRPMLSATQWRNVGEPFPGCEESVELFKPLNALRALHAKKTVTHVVLSVGGNDVREILREMNKLSSVITVYHRNFREIVRHIRGSSSTTKERPQLIIMLQYRPSIAMDADGYGVYRAIGGSIGAKGDSAALLAMNQLMKTIYAPVLTLAKESNLPVIDLPRTFDPFDAECYRFYKDGKICLDILQKKWSPSFDLASVLVSIQSLLCDPNPDSPANPVASRIFEDDKEEYRKNVRACVEGSWAYNESY
eukprot:g890.t1